VNRSFVPDPSTQPATANRYRVSEGSSARRNIMRIVALRAALLAVVVLVMSSVSFGQVRISVAFGPPALPVYEQPLCPGDGYIWTPGYWAWSDDIDDYYWVPGTWVSAPEVGFLWTPPYWGWADSSFVFYDGYWGPHVGFYGGINYGFGYFGAGFEGGRWENDHFFYNRSVTNVNVTNIHNVYNTTVVNNNTTINRVSYNGGNGGVNARPTPEEEAAAHDRHIPPASVQVQHMQAAHDNPELRASANHGKPPVAATAKPGEFKGNDAVAAREAGAPYNPPANRGGARPGGENGGNSAPPVHAKDLPPMEKPAAPNTGNAKLDQKYQQQQQKLQQQQDQERQKLSQQQEKEDQRMSQQNANDARKQQTEQRHQQQTQQLQQRHAQQQQQMMQRQAPPPAHPEGRPPKG
jgi:WXXGXW repeat (2 copies)